MYSKNIYIILFKNGIAKAGYSSDISRRISQHRSAAKAMGTDIEKIWLTITGHRNIQESETKILQLMSEEFKNQTKEFFSGATVSAVKKVSQNSGFQFIEAVSVSGKSGGRLVIEVMEQLSADDGKPSEKSKILKTITENNGITLGVLCSKHRKITPNQINEEIESLLSDGLITKKESTHEYSKKKISRLFAC